MAAPSQIGMLANNETGRAEFRCYGAASVRLALAGGGYVAVGNEPGGARPSAAVSMDDSDPYAQPAAVPTYYRQRAQRVVSQRQAAYGQPGGYAYCGN